MDKLQNFQPTQKQFVRLRSVSHIFLQDQKKKVIGTILWIYDVLCLKDFAYTSVSCKIIVKVKNLPNLCKFK